MRAFFWVLALLIILIFISPFYSLYKIGTGIKDKDVNTLNAYIVWNEIQDSVKYDVSEYLKNREELRKKDLDNPIDGVFEDIRKIGGEIFGGKALDIAIKKVVTPEGIIKIVEIAEKKSTNNITAESNPTENNNINIKEYSLESFNFISPSNFEATVLTPQGDIYFKMRFHFPRWHLYTVKSQKLTDEIAKKVEESVNLLKNLNKTLFEGLKE